jgi:isopropylmalate/homocitrate/citramalate synthase
MKLLICGDSFAADWTVKYNDVGWPNMLANDYKITNLAQAGCGEYKIYKQLVSVNLDEYDAIIVSHTSPTRIYINSHPVHAHDLLHKNSDLIYADIVEHAKSNKSLKPIVDYFENYFDLEYAMFVHTLLCEKIENHLTTFYALELRKFHFDPFQ